jgi:hypothetical protein
VSGQPIRQRRVADATIAGQRIDGNRADWSISANPRPAPAAATPRIYPGGMHLSPWVTRDRQAAMPAIVTG